MLKKKICLLGAFGVGKTSLCQKFVNSIFSEKYQTTVGVKIDKKIVFAGERDITLMIWDMAGEEPNREIKLNLLRGASGYLLVADGTRFGTLDVAQSIHERVEQEIGSIPFLLLVNKADLKEEWDKSESRLSLLKQRGWNVLDTSAKSGQNVDHAFQSLTELMLQPDD